jgi:hypothetical protein
VSAIDEPSTIDESLELEITPRYVNASVFAVSLSINSSGKAMSYAYASAATYSNSVYLTITLQRYTSSGWTNVKSWSTSGTREAELDKSYYVTSGYSYRTKAVATLYTSSGSYVEQITAYSKTVSY